MYDAKETIWGKANQNITNQRHAYLSRIYDLETSLMIFRYTRKDFDSG